MLTGFSTSWPCCGFYLGSELCRSKVQVTCCNTSTDGQKSVHSTEIDCLIPLQLSMIKCYKLLKQRVFSPWKHHPNLPIPLEMDHGLVTFQNHLLKIEQVILILLSPLGELPNCRMLPTDYRLPLPFRSTEFTYWEQKAVPHFIRKKKRFGGFNAYRQETWSFWIKLADLSVLGLL